MSAVVKQEHELFDMAVCEESHSSECTILQNLLAGRSRK